MYLADQNITVKLKRKNAGRWVSAKLDCSPLWNPTPQSRSRPHLHPTRISVTQLRLFVHLRSLGVLTAAGCEIGSVHSVVRSNLLVEPSEVEEGEM
ncbi:hypothetical protein F511_23921 [Dorcoceras hygrometricum]|uniref:Uncharacterized protein n=1 Tax=Dorcoceras hygrometricum TaxID=472368 RepID=A0A2Z7BYB7_9LAMI|nr:hypothetical protein F511_23921 [Dorcoceras hygrometricum]